MRDEVGDGIGACASPDLRVSHPAVQSSNLGNVECHRRAGSGTPEDRGGRGE